MQKPASRIFFNQMQYALKLYHFHGWNVGFAHSAQDCCVSVFLLYLLIQRVSEPRNSVFGVISRTTFDDPRSECYWRVSQITITFSECKPVSRRIVESVLASLAQNTIESKIIHYNNEVTANQYPSSQTNIHEGSQLSCVVNSRHNSCWSMKVSNHNWNRQSLNLKSALAQIPKIKL